MIFRTVFADSPFGWLSFLPVLVELVRWSPGYEADERSAAVYIFKATSAAAENIGHRKPGCRTDERKAFD